MAYILQTRSEEIIFAGPNQYPSELAQNQIDETWHCRSAAVLRSFRGCENIAFFLFFFKKSIKMCNLRQKSENHSYLFLFYELYCILPRCTEMHQSIFLYFFPIKLFSQVQQAMKMAKSSWHTSLERMRMMRRRRKRTSSLLTGVKMKWKQKFWTMCELGE